MEVTRIISGSWFPRTKLHLKEYFTFLKDAKTHLPLDTDTLMQSHDILSPENTAYHGGRFDTVTASMRGYDVSYSEDGLLLITKEVNNLLSDIVELRHFYDDRIAVALSFIYSLGTPVILHSIPHVGTRPMLIITKGATKDDVNGLMAELEDEVHFVATEGKTTVHFGDDHILIDTPDPDDPKISALASMLILFREYEHKLRHFLDLHRTIWESIVTMRDKETLVTKDLPIIRDTLLDYRRDLAVIHGRLGQMEAYIEARNQAVDDAGLSDWLTGLETYRFVKLGSATRYIKELWNMLNEYIESTVAITGLLYQENLRKEINFQQFIFLVSAVAGTITLGTLAGADIFLEGPAGEPISGTMYRFKIIGIVKFGGIAIFTSALIFLVIRPLVSSFKRIKTSTLLRGTTMKKPRK